MSGGAAPGKVRFMFARASAIMRSRPLAARSALDSCSCTSTSFSLLSRNSRLALHKGQRHECSRIWVLVQLPEAVTDCRLGCWQYLTDIGC